MQRQRSFSNSILRFLIIVASCASSPLGAQTKDIDLLFLAIQNAKDDKEKSDLYSQLADKLYGHDFEKGLIYAQEALNLSVRSDYIRGQSQALTAIGTYHYYNGDYKQSLKFYDSALKILNGKIEGDFPVKTYLRLGILFRHQSAFDSSTLYFNKAQSILKNEKTGLLHASLYASQGLLADAVSKNGEALSLLKKSLSIRLKFGDSIRISDTWCNLGVVYNHISQYDSAEYCYSKAENFLRHINDPETQMHISLSRGETAFSRGNFNDAIDHYTKALNALKKNTYKRYYAVILFKIGELYENQGAYHTAYDYLFSALKEFEKTNARQDMARAYTQIGWCYNYQENYTSALVNANNSLRIAEEIKDSASIGQNQNLIGFTFFKTKQYDEAIASFEQALTIRKRINHWWGVSFTLYNTALTYNALGQVDRAFDLLMQSLEIDQRIGKKVGIIFTCNELGYLYSKQKNFLRASYYLDQASKLAKSVPVPPQLLVNYKNQIFLYEQQRNDSKIIKYYKLYTALKDSLSNEINSSRISKADALFQLQKKAAEVELVNKENEFNQERIKSQQADISFQRLVIIIVSVCLVILFILALVIYKLFKSNKRAKEILGNQNMEIEAQGKQIKEAIAELEAINDQLERRVEDRTSQLNKAYDELETFFYRTSHDFRRPLTTYLGLVEVAKSTIQDKQALELFAKVKETTLGFDAMLSKLQSISNADSNSGLSHVSLRELTRECYQKYVEFLDSKHIEWSTDLKVDILTSNYLLLKIILENLIENAMNFCTPEHPFIKIIATKNAEDIRILVEDNGQGIADELQSRIFTMYFRASDNSKGNGLGLYIAKRATEKLGGNISFSSTRFKGTSFEITIPL